MKRKLFLLLCALLTMIGVQAADLPASGSGEYFIKNVETGTFLKGDMYWGTKACVWDDPYLLTLTYVSEGVYTIKSQQNNGGQKQYISSGDDVYVDALAANMTFTEVDGENHYFTINNGTGNLTAVSQTEDGVQLYKVMATSETSTLAQWEVISKNELIAALDVASASNPVVATFFIGTKQTSTFPRLLPVFPTASTELSAMATTAGITVEIITTRLPLQVMQAVPRF